MQTDSKKEERKQYLRYFRFWFLAVGVLAVLCIVFRFMKPVNNEAPSERVYDYADVLTVQEEESLRQHIAQMEQKKKIHIVLVTVSQSVEGEEAKRQYGYRFTDWERNMQDLADDFWDENRYGYNKGFEGDGVLLLHNWYPGQNGEHLSSSGKVEREFDDYDINRVLDMVDSYYETNPYKAYMAYVDEVGALLGSFWDFPFPWMMVLILPFAVASIYSVCNLHQTKARNTTAVNAYVAGGKPVVNSKSDDFVRKSVVTRRIQTSSGTGRSSHSSGGGGSHHSRSGASHGGGSHRH